VEHQAVNRDVDAILSSLLRSSFRRRFRLSERDLAYCRDKGMETNLDHARDFVGRRLAPAEPHNDGRQTPMRGHPVFVAQHATATCCRRCLQKWHRLPLGRPLSDANLDYIRHLIAAWLRLELERLPAV